jgi:hypothetical protein
MTWKRLIARINSGSAVFIARAFPLVPPDFLREAELFSSPGGVSTARLHIFLPVLID